MKNLVSNFESQILEALQIGKEFDAKDIAKKYNEIVLSGLGGSGIGGSIVADYCYNILSIPFIINKSYFIPKFVSSNTLFIACSYSGNTEETLQAVKLAKTKKATIVCITSGGELEKYARKNKLPLIQIPSGMPPRACLGYSLVQILYVFKKAGILNTNFEKELNDGLDLIKKEKKNIEKTAKNIAQKLLNRNIAIYAIDGNEGLSIRFRQQLNENSKVLAWHNVVPEMTHNEIVGWKKPHEEIVALFCYHHSDYEKNIRRIKFLKKTINQYNKNSVELIIQGNSFWEKAIYFIHLTDWISVYLADLNGNDAVEVKVIDGLKKEMAKNNLV